MAGMKALTAPNRGTASRRVATSPLNIGFLASSPLEEDGKEVTSKIHDVQYNFSDTYFKRNQRKTRNFYILSFCVSNRDPNVEMSGE